MILRMVVKSLECPVDRIKPISAPAKTFRDAEESQNVYSFALHMQTVFDPMQCGLLLKLIKAVLAVLPELGSVLTFLMVLQILLNGSTSDS